RQEPALSRHKANAAVTHRMRSDIFAPSMGGMQQRVNLEMINRRDFLAGTSAAFACADLHAATATADADTEKLLAGLAEELLGEYPENATGLGIDRGERASLKSK